MRSHTSGVSSRHRPRRRGFRGDILLLLVLVARFPALGAASDATGGKETPAQVARCETPVSSLEDAETRRLDTKARSGDEMAMVLLGERLLASAAWSTDDAFDAGACWLRVASRGSRAAQAREAMQRGVDQLGVREHPGLQATPKEGAEVSKDSFALREYRRDLREEAVIPSAIAESKLLHEDAQQFLWYVFSKGPDTIEPYNPTIREHFRRLAQEGQPKAVFIDAVIRFAGLGEPRDTESSRGALVTTPYLDELVTTAAVLYEEGRHRAAAEIWRIAADRGRADAEYNYGVSMRDRFEYVEARRAFERALQLAPNMLIAKTNLAQMLIKGWGGEKDTDRGVRLYLEVAKAQAPKDDYEAEEVIASVQQLTGEYYCRGRLVPENRELCREWLEKSAAAGELEAGRSLLWWFGDPTPPNGDCAEPPEGAEYHWWWQDLFVGPEGEGDREALRFHVVASDSDGSGRAFLQSRPVVCGESSDCGRTEDSVAVGEAVALRGHPETNGFVCVRTLGLSPARAGWIDGSLIVPADPSLILLGGLGYTPLHFAAIDNDAHAVMRYLERFPVDARTAFDETPLALAAQNGSVEAVGILIAHGADANARRADGETVWRLALSSGAFDSLEALRPKVTDRADIDAWGIAAGTYARNPHYDSCPCNDGSQCSVRLVTRLEPRRATLCRGRGLRHGCVALSVPMDCDKLKLFDDNFSNNSYNAYDDLFAHQAVDEDCELATKVRASGGRDRSTQDFVGTFDWCSSRMDEYPGAIGSWLADAPDPAESTAVQSAADGMLKELREEFAGSQDLLARIDDLRPVVERCRATNGAAFFGLSDDFVEKPSLESGRCFSSEPEVWPKPGFEIREVHLFDVNGDGFQDARVWSLTPGHGSCCPSIKAYVTRKSSAGPWIFPLPQGSK